MKEIRPARRLQRIPPYPFAKLDELACRKREEGKDLISFGIGDPDLPPPENVVAALREAALDSQNHKYSSNNGERFFREAVAEWYRLRFGVELDPEKNVTTLIGSKEGIANLARALVSPQERVLVPSPAYPVYMNGATFLSDGDLVKMILLKEKAFLPEIENLPYDGARLLFINYPNNPTGAVAEKGFLEEVVGYCRKTSTPLCYDHAYSEMTFDDFQSHSILEADGASDIALEIHSCSKTFCMTGSRIGFAVGNEQLISYLRRVKTQVDSGPPIYVQKAGAEALLMYRKGTPDFVVEMRRTYEERMKALVCGLLRLGFEAEKPKATFYLWMPCSREGEILSSSSFTERMIDLGIVVTPGTAFGEEGEGYVRFAVTSPEQRIKEALERMAEVF